MLFIASIIVNSTNPPSPGLPLSQVPIVRARATLVPTQTAISHLGVQLDAWTLATGVPTSTPRPTVIPIESPTPVATLVPSPRYLQLWDHFLIPVVSASREHYGFNDNASKKYRWTVPPNVAAWHPDTDDCGTGTSIIGGHVSFNGMPGVFRDLASIQEQEQVLCVDSQQAQHIFEPVDYLITHVTAPISSWHPDWSPALLLYTCTPELNGQIIVLRFKKLQ